jgi:sulfofructose kinase
MDVLCVGHTAWDISVFVAGYPAENSKREIHTMVECGGGPAANAAFLLSRWGLASAFAGVVGADAYGERIAREFFDAGTDITLLRRNADDVTPVSVILVNEQNGSRTIINRRVPRTGAPLQLSPPPAWPQPVRVLFFDGHEPEASLEAMKLFPQAKTILDAGSLRDGTRELAKRVDYLVASERFARELSGLPDLEGAENQATAVAALHWHNGKPVVITCGERGLLHGTSGHVEWLPALPVKVCDTTAAGDIFHGAFAYGILSGLPWLETLRLAAGAAALSVTVRGGRTSIPSLADVKEMLRHAH